MQVLVAQILMEQLDMEDVYIVHHLVVVIMQEIQMII